MELTTKASPEVIVGPTMVSNQAQNTAAKEMTAPSTAQLENEKKNPIHSQDTYAPPTPRQHPASPVASTDMLRPGHPLAADRWVMLEADVVKYSAESLQLKREKHELEGRLQGKEKELTVNVAERDATVKSLEVQLASMRQQLSMAGEEREKTTAKKDEMEKELTAKNEELGKRLTAKNQDIQRQLTAKNDELDKERTSQIEQLDRDLRHEKTIRCQYEAEALQAKNEAEASTVALQKVTIELSAMKLKYDEAQEMMSAKEQLNLTLKGRVSSLENVITNHEAVKAEVEKRRKVESTNVTADAAQSMEFKLEELLESKVSERGEDFMEKTEPITIPKPMIDGAALRKRAADRIEQGELKADENVDAVADLNEIKNSKYPVNLSQRLLEASTELSEPEVSTPGTTKRKLEREERLGNITASWDKEVSRFHNEENERRASLASVNA